MNKTEFIELIQENLSGGIITDEVKTKYHPQVIAAAIDLALEEITAAQTIGRNRQTDRVYDALTATFPCLEISCDEKRTEYFLDIPVPYMNLPQGRGIRHVGISTNPATKYQQLGISQLGDLFGLDAVNLDQYYYVENQRIWFFNVKEPQIPVRVVIVPKFLALDDETEVNIPMGKSSTLFQMVTASLQSLKATPEEKINNNVSDVP